ncbi:MAG: DUF427 domain-containing protein [Rhizobiaceae bacterium]
MTQISQQTSNDYGISVLPVDHEVKLYCGDTLVAVSSRARVMHETRLPATLYFPVEDIVGTLTANPNHRTFCPFKGTASYFNLQVDDQSFANAAWSYEKALPESRDVEGYVAFMPSVVTKIDHGGYEIDPMDSGNISGPTVDWVMREAWLCKTPEELTAALARKFIHDGIAISRMSILIWSLHPMIAGKNYIWTKETDEVRAFSASYDIHKSPAFLNSPLRHVSNGLGGVRQRFDGSPIEFDFPIIGDLKEQGASDYVAMPLPFSNGQINVMTLTSDHPKGFTTPNLGLLFECSSVISRYFEVFTLQENAQSLLETYLGKRTGARVLGGEIRRGDGDDIQAAILFCDLRNSTSLEERLGREAYVSLLNQFFETTTEIINQRDGEVLKFIGDAVLAIFPAGDDKQQACNKALDSAQEIVAHLASNKIGGGGDGGGDEQTDGDRESEEGEQIDCSIGIAYGDVTYGNVGSRERLDFTVIGRAANIAARLGDYGKTVGQRIVTTHDIASSHDLAHSLGDVTLHNVAEPVATFALATDAAPSS